VAVEAERELILAVDPFLYRAVPGSTDSETFFLLAVTLVLLQTGL
jgi:asparagine N-glycosylation enzyme membrane subunit Stt3